MADCEMRTRLKGIFKEATLAVGRHPEIHEGIVKDKFYADEERRLEALLTAARRAFQAHRDEHRCELEADG